MNGGRLEPVDVLGTRHTCPDETAIAVNGKWLCVCLGGPFFYLNETRLAHLRGRRPVEPLNVTHKGVKL